MENPCPRREFLIVLVLVPRLLVLDGTTETLRGRKDQDEKIEYEPPMTTENSVSPPDSDAADQNWFGQNSWLPFVLPMFVFMLLGQFEPSPPAAAKEVAAEAGLLEYRYYPVIYTARIVLTLAAMFLALPMYRAFPLRINWLAPACGFAGVILWIGLCSLQLEEKYILPNLSFLFGESSGRAAYNPLEQLGDRPVLMIGFLAVRFLGLALIVPIIEEFFLRGFLLRFVQNVDWWKVPIGAAQAAAWAAVVAYAILSHPGEMVAAVVWFSLITWLVLRTKNIWDAVAAHAVTNLLLGVYVLTTGQWQLW